MKVLITGSDGYIGTMLVPVLLARGHDIVGLDMGFYRDGSLYNGVKSVASLIRKDIRHVSTDDVKGFDAVVHLAELSNDPLGQLNPDITHQINHQGSVALAENCKRAGVPRFVYTSSCSVYGAAGDQDKTETSEVNPQTAYATCKVLVERDVSAIATAHFSPTFLRNATAYGASPRMRFDIVLNNLSGLAWTTKQIRMISDGTPWRPLVHILDICEAIACTLAAPREAVHNQIFNVGDNENNYRVKEIAAIVAGVFPGCELKFGASTTDNRSYRVNFDKIHRELPGFRCRWNASQGAQELFELFQRITFTREMFETRSFTRLKQLEHLIRTHQIDSHFFWKK